MLVRAAFLTSSPGEEFGSLPDLLGSSPPAGPKHVSQSPPHREGPVLVDVAAQRKREDAYLFVKILLHPVL